MLKLILQWKNNLSNTSKLQKFLAKAIAGTFGLKIINAILLYFNSLLLARILGANGFGLYSYATSWGYLLLIPSALGMEGLFLREIAVYKTKSEWSLARGLLDWGNKLVLTNSTIIAILAAVGFWLTRSSQNPEMLAVMCIAMISVPFDALSRLRQPTMHAINKIVLGQLPEALIGPVVLSVLLAVTALILQIQITASQAMIMKGISVVATFVAGSLLLYVHLPSTIKNIAPNYQPRIWFKSALPMLLIGSMYVINGQTDIIMLGMLDTPAAVGIYTVANRGAGLITFVLIAFDTSIAPTFANLYTESNIIQLQKIVTQSCRIVFAIALLIAVILIVFGKWLLLIFGAEFVQGYLVLNILSLGQLVNAFSGSVAMLLIMTGYDKCTAIGVSISAIVNIILNAFFIPLWDAEGAALATAISMVCWNLILIYFAGKKLKINSTPFSFKLN